MYDLFILSILFDLGIMIDLPVLKLLGFLVSLVGETCLIVSS